MSRLDWAELEEACHARWLARYRTLLEIRAREIVPRLAGMPAFAGRYHVQGPQAVIVEWQLGDRSRLTLMANFSGQAVAAPPAADVGRLIYASATPGAPMSVSFFLSAPAPK